MTNIKFLKQVLIVAVLLVLSLYLSSATFSFHYSPNAAIDKTKMKDSLVVDGYFNKFAFEQGEKAYLYLNCKVVKDSVLFGVYDVLGNLISSVKSTAIPQKTKSLVPYLSGFGYIPTAIFPIPKNLRSGLYFIANKIPFLVKNSSPNKGDFLVIHPSHTDLAYNNNGGYSYYFPSHKTRARMVSFDRPWTFGQNGDPRPFYKWLREKNYRVDFMADDEMQEYKNLADYKLLLIAGHSEYWTRKARQNFDKFVDSDKNALILSGNTMYWQTRIDSVNRQLICYKYDAQTNDPIKDPLLKTCRWENKMVKYDQRFSIGVNFFMYGGFSTKRVNNPQGFGGMKIILPDFPIFKDMNLKKHDIIAYNGIEYDGGKVKLKKDTESNYLPMYDNSETKFYKVDILGWDYAIPDYGIKQNRYHAGLMLALKLKPTAGLIITMSSSNWCNELQDKPQLQQITANAIDFLLKNNDYTLSIIKEKAEHLK